MSLAELRFGIAALPEGKRRDALHASLAQRVLPLFAGRILTFDDPASQSYATLRARARAAGQAIAAADGYIAAIAAAHGLAVATRDTSPFEAAGLSVINRS
ncbi:MAG: PIN domain-containing protein [Rhodoferax sp.]|nr:PIN domain-containing protein [Rhodoferax sp.]